MNIVTTTETTRRAFWLNKEEEEVSLVKQQKMCDTNTCRRRRRCDRRALRLNNKKEDNHHRREAMSPISEALCHQAPTPPVELRLNVKSTLSAYEEKICDQQEDHNHRRRRESETSWLRQYQKLKPTSKKAVFGFCRLKPSIASLMFILLFVIVMLCSAGWSVVVYQVRFISVESGRTDYVLAGESMELTCHHMMKDEAEDIKQVIWSKDGKNFLRWRKRGPGLEVLSDTFKGHLDARSTRDHLIVHSTSIEMHGKYKCLMRTDLGQHEAEHELIVIARSHCSLADWRILSEQTSCRETYKLDCRHMFPRPVPACGLWNDKLNKFIRSVTLDISEEPQQQQQQQQQTTTTTYRVKYSDKFDLQSSGAHDLLQYAGHLMFKCDIVVPNTSWKLSLKRQMFNYTDGCNQDPLETIARMRVNFSQYAKMRMLNGAPQLSRTATSKQQQQQHTSNLIATNTNDIEMLTSNLKYEILPPPHGAKEVQQFFTVGNQSQKITKPNTNCWQKPSFGTLAKLSCVSTTTSSPVQHSRLKLVGTSLLECRLGGWVPIREQRDKTRLSLNKSKRQLETTRKTDLDNTNKNNENHNDNNNNDDDDDDDDDSTILETNHALDTTIENHIPHDTSTAVLDFDAKRIDVAEQHLDASLLPSCVLITPPKALNTHNQRRLPLLDAAGNRVLEQLAADNSQNKPTSSMDGSYNWINFLSSISSSSNTWAPSFVNHMSLVAPLVLVANYVISARSSRNNNNI